jgi:hypothetical protein
MSNILPVQRPAQRETRGSRVIPVSRASGRALTQVEERTLIRIARVQSEGMVQGEKIRELTHLGRNAETDHALLYKWANTLAAGDPMLHDELRFFGDMVRMGMGEIIADTIDTYCRESRS